MPSHSVNSTGSAEAFYVLEPCHTYSCQNRAIDHERDIDNLACHPLDLVVRNVNSQSQREGTADHGRVDGVAFKDHSHFSLGLVTLLIRILGQVVTQFEVFFEHLLKDFEVDSQNHKRDRCQEEEEDVVAVHIH